MSRHGAAVDRREEWAALRARYLSAPAERARSSARGVHHIALLSSNVEATIAFYQGVLEFPLTELFENRDYQGSTHFFFDIGHGNLLAFFDFPGLDPRVQVPFVRLMLEFCAADKALDGERRRRIITSTIDIVERIQQEIRKVGFWKDQAKRELLTKRLVRDLNDSGCCPAGKERELAQQLVELAKENHENLTRQ